MNVTQQLIIEKIESEIEFYCEESHYHEMEAPGLTIMEDDAGMRANGIRDLVAELKATLDV